MGHMWLVYCWDSDVLKTVSRDQQSLPVKEGKGLCIKKKHAAIINDFLFSSLFVLNCNPKLVYLVIVHKMHVCNKVVVVGQVLTLCRPVDSRLEHVDFDSLLQCLSVGKLLQVFASLVLERRVIFVADKLRYLCGNMQMSYVCLKHKTQ